MSDEQTPETPIDNRAEVREASEGGPEASEAAAESPEAGESAEADEAPAPAPAKPKGGSAKVQVALILATVGLVLAIVLSLPRKADLVVDNGFPFRLKVLVNGVDYGEIERGESRRCERLPAGAVKLEAVELGPEGQEGQRFRLDAELEVAFFTPRRQTYVWNVEGKTRHYWIISRGYGDRSKETFAPLKFEPATHLFTIPDGLVPLLNDFPSEIRAKGKGAVRKALFSHQKVRQIQLMNTAEKFMGGEGAGMAFGKSKSGEKTKK